MWLELRDLLGPHERFQREGVLIFVDLHFFFFFDRHSISSLVSRKKEMGGGTSR